MYTSASGDMIFFVASFFSGLIIAFLYDLIRISRRIVAASASVLGIQDILFFVFAALILFCAAYTKNQGEVRWQGFLGCACGILIYSFLIRNRFVNLGTTTVKWLIRACLWLLKVILFPLKIVFWALKKPIEVIAWYTGSRLRLARRIINCKKAKAKMRLKSALSLVRKR